MIMFVRKRKIKSRYIPPLGDVSEIKNEKNAKRPAGCSKKGTVFNGGNNCMFVVWQNGRD